MEYEEATLFGARAETAASKRKAIVKVGRENVPCTEYNMKEHRCSDEYMTLFIPL